MSNNTGPGRVILRWAVPAVAISVVVTSLLLSGLFNQGPAKDIDSRYFYIAAKLWDSGQSPYDISLYASSFAAQFGTPPNNGYPYLPTSFLFLAPLGLFDWPTAAALFSWMNFAAALLMLACFIVLVRRAVKGPLKPSHWFWIALGASLGGIPATIFTGQSSIIIAAAAALAVVGLNGRWPWLTALALLIAAAKPQLAFSLLLFVPLLGAGRLKVTVMTAVVFVASLIAAAVVDPHLAQNFIDTLGGYRAAGVNDPGNGIGVAGLFSKLGLPTTYASLVGLTLGLGLMALAVWKIVKTKRPLAEQPDVIILLVLIVGTALPIHDYDVACFGLAIALIGTQRPGFQWSMLVPALLVFRPAALAALVAKVLPGASQTLDATAFLILGWLGLLAISVFLPRGRSFLTKSIPN